MHAQRVQSQNARGLGQQAPTVWRDHRDVEDVRASRRFELDVDLAFRCERHETRFDRIWLRQWLTGHDQSTTALQVTDQRGLPVTPYARARGQGIGFGERVQQLQEQRVAAERVDDGGNRLRVLQVPTRRDVGQQKV